MKSGQSLFEELNVLSGFFECHCNINDSKVTLIRVD